MSKPPLGRSRGPFTAPIGSWRKIADDTAAREAEARRNYGAPKPHTEAEGLKILSDLFAFAQTAATVDAALDSGNIMFKGQSRPPRCNRTAGTHGRCNLPLRKDEAAQGACAFHKAVAAFGATGFDAADIYLGAPAKEAVAARLSALKP